MSLSSRADLAGPEILKEAPSHPLILNPDRPVPWLAQHGALPLMSPAWVAELDLIADRGTRLARQHQKWRNRLKQAENHPLRITQAPLHPTKDRWLFNADAAQQKARGYRSWPEAITRAFAQLHPQKARLFTAFEDREPVAAMLFLQHGSAATYHMGHTTPRGRQLNAHTRLLWEASNGLAKRKVRKLELGYIDTETAPGLARFKLGSGATARPLGGTWLWWPPYARLSHATQCGIARAWTNLHPNGYLGARQHEDSKNQ